MFAQTFLTSRDAAVRIRAAAERDPLVLAALRQAYTGRHDIVDALDWRLTPLEPSARSTPDPSAELARIGRRTFSRDGIGPPVITDPDPVTGAPLHLTADELRLMNLERMLTADAVALDSAIEAVLARDRGGTPAGRLAPVGAPAHQFTDAPALGAPDRPPDPRLGHRWTPLIAAVTVSALVSVAGLLWWRLQDTQARLDVAAGPDPDPVTAWREVNATTIPALLVFNRSQAIDDVYPLQLPVAYDMRAVRQLLPYESGDAYRLFGALADPDQVCAVAVLADLSSTSTCVSDRDFAQHGILITTHAIRERRSAGGPATFVSHQVRWLPDGTFESTPGS